MELLAKTLPIAAGGALGAVARYLINISPLAAAFDRFPLPTFVINISGSFLAGFLMIFLTDKFVVSESLRLAVIVGFLGAFTTFSTFEAEIYGMTEERQFSLSVFYMIASVAVGFVAVLAGVAIARKI